MTVDPFRSPTMRNDDAAYRQMPPPDGTLDAAHRARHVVCTHQLADARCIDVAQPRQIQQDPSLTAAQKSLDFLAQCHIDRCSQSPFDFENRRRRALFQKDRHEPLLPAGSASFHPLPRLARQPTLLRFIHDVGELPVPLHLQDDRIAWSESRKRFAQLCRCGHPCAVDGVNDITPREG